MKRFDDGNGNFLEIDQDGVWINLDTENSKTHVSLKLSPLRAEAVGLGVLQAVADLLAKSPGAGAPLVTPDDTNGSGVRIHGPTGEADDWVYIADTQVAQLHRELTLWLTARAAQRETLRTMIKVPRWR